MKLHHSTGDIQGNGKTISLTNLDDEKMEGGTITSLLPNYQRVFIFSR